MGLCASLSRCHEESPSAVQCIAMGIYGKAACRSCRDGHLLFSTAKKEGKNAAGGILLPPVPSACGARLAGAYTVVIPSKCADHRSEGKHKAVTGPTSLQHGHKGRILLPTLTFCPRERCAVLFHVQCPRSGLFFPFYAVILRPQPKNPPWRCDVLRRRFFGCGLRMTIFLVEKAGSGDYALLQTRRKAFAPHQHPGAVYSPTAVGLGSPQGLPRCTVPPYFAANPACSSLFAASA